MGVGKFFGTILVALGQGHQATEAGQIFTLSQW